MGVATASEVATDGDPIVFDGEEKVDFGNRELGLLRKVSKKVESKRSFSGLMAQAFLHGTKGEEGIVSSVVRKEATGWTTGGGDEEGSLVVHFEAEATAFGSSEDLSFVELLPYVFTIVS